ncbi:MAG: fibronectin type III domain-containing protein, partial [Bacteroidota bacterium]|nr:fibronectin type III domain-containing protein [Bacteroidota bacterium]
MKRLLMFLLMATILSISASWGQTTTPLNEGFEEGLPDTWTNTNTISNAQGWVISNYYGNNSTSSMYANYNYNYGQNCYLITPQLMPVSGSNSLSFYIMINYPSYSEYSTLTVEVSTTNTNTSSFTSVSTITFPTTSYTWEQRTIDLSAYDGQTIYVAFHFVDDNGTAVYIDNVSGLDAVESECSTPHGFTVDINSDQATLSWTSTGSDFEIYYKEGSATDYTTTTSFSAGEEDNTYTATISDLTPLTSYDVYVKVLCDDNTEQQSTVFSFTMPMTAVSLPYTTDFSGDETTGDTNWYFQNHTSTAHWVFGTITTDTNAMFVSTDGTTPGYSTSNTTRVSAEKTFSVGDDAKIKVEFDAKVGGETAYDYLKVFLTSDAWSFPASASENTYSPYNYSTNALNFSDYVTTSYPYTLTLTQGNYIHYEGEMHNPNPNGAIKLTFVWVNDGGSGTQPGAIIKNVSISAVECPTPDVTVSDIAAHTANINISGGDSYTVEYKASTNEDWTTATESDGVASLSDLAPETTYQVRVASNCGTSVSEYTLVNFTTTISCPVPVITLDNATTSTATLSWTGSAEEYTIRYKLNTETEWTEETTSENTIDLESLTSSSVYNVEIIANCGDYDGYSDTATFTFTTSCEAITTLPITWDFEASGNTSGTYPLPVCWQRATSASTYYPNYPYSASTSYANSGSMALYFYGEGYAVLPQIDASTLSVNNLQLLLHARKGEYYYSNSIQVGVMTDPTDASTFVSVASFNLTTTQTAYEVSFSSYTGTGTYIAIRSHSSDYYYSYYAAAIVDDVTLDVLPGCTRPDNLTFDASSEQITVGWESDGTNFEIYYKESSATEYSTVTNFTAGTEEGTWTTTISNLTSNTSYDLYVKALCDDGTTPATEVATIFTPIPAVDLPYSTDFSGEENTGDTNWLFRNNTSNIYWVYGNITADSTAMFITTDGTTAGYDVNSIAKLSAEKTFNIGDNAKIRVEFDVKIGGESSYDYMKVFLTDGSWYYPASNNETVYSNYEYSTNALNFADYLSQTGGSTSYPYKLNLTQGNYIHYAAELDNPNPNGVVKLTFVWKNDGSLGTQPAIVLKNVSVSAVACPTLTEDDYTISNIAGHSATVTMLEGYDYSVEYKASTEEDWTVATNVTDNVASLSGLAPETTYQVRVLTVCDNVNSAYSDIKTFTTTIACPAPVITLGTLTTTSASLSWTGDASSYTVRYKESTEETWTEETANENTYTIEQLTPSTLYNVEIIANCGDEDGVSLAGTTNFRTACVSVTEFPYLEDFETLTTSDLGCWTNEIVAGSSNWGITTITSINNKQAYRSFTDGAITRLISPTFDLSSINAPFLSYNWEACSYGGNYDSLYVYYRTSQEEDWTLLIANGSSHSGGASSTGATQYDTMSLPNPSATYQIAFTAVGNNGYGIYLDNVSIVNRECEGPTNLSVSDISAQTATLSWEGTATVLEYKTTGEDSWTSLSVTESPYTLQEVLTPHTHYEVRVGVLCPSGSISYAPEVAFTTRMLAVDLPYSTDFSGTEDTGDTTWVINNYSSTNNYWKIGTIGTDTAALFVTNNGTTAGYSHGATRLVAEKIFNAGSSEQIHIEFDIKSGGESYYDFLKVLLSDATWSFPASYSESTFSSYSFSANSDNSVSALNFSNYLSQTSVSTDPYKINLTQGNYIHYSADITNPNPNGEFKLIFMWRNDGSYGDQNSAIIRNVSVSAVTCSMPLLSDISITNIAGHSATITLPEEGEYIVEYKTNADEDWTTATGVEDNVVSLSGLAPETTYQLRVAKVCDDGNSAYVQTSFTTDIACPMPVITVSDVTNNSATLSWTGDADSYNVRYKLSSANDWTEETVNNANTFDLSGLSSLSYYDVEVIANCGTEDGNSQAGTITFETNMLAVDLPYSTDFSGTESTGDTVWLFRNHTSTNYWMFGTIGTDTTAMFVTTDGTTPGYDADYSTRVSTEKTFNVGSSEQLHIEFDVKVGGEGSYGTPYDFLKVFLTDGSWYFPASTSESSYSTYSYSTNALNFADYLSQTEVSTNPYKLNLTQGNYIHYSADVTNPNPDGVVKLTFMWRNDGSTSDYQPAVIIRNVSISEVGSTVIDPVEPTVATNVAS